MSNPNEECRKGKKVKDFYVGQEVYTIKLAQGLEGFAFKRWVIGNIMNCLPTPYLLVSGPDGTKLKYNEFILLCGDSIFATPQEAAEELHEKLAKLNRAIEIANYPSNQTNWDEFIV